MEKIEPIRFETGFPMLLGGLRRNYAYSESGQGIAEQWQEFQTLGQLPGQIGNTVYGAMAGANADSFEYMSAAEVESFENLPDHIHRMRILPQYYAVFLHQGHISTIRSTWERIFKEWFPRSGYQSAHKPDFEVYTDEFDPIIGIGGVEIWVSIEQP